MSSGLLIYRRINKVDTFCSSKSYQQVNFIYGAETNVSSLQLISLNTINAQLKCAENEYLEYNKNLFFMRR